MVCVRCARFALTSFCLILKMYAFYFHCSRFLRWWYVHVLALTWVSNEFGIYNLFLIFWDLLWHVKNNCINCSPSVLATRASCMWLVHTQIIIHMPSFNVICKPFTIYPSNIFFCCCSTVSLHNVVPILWACCMTSVSGTFQEVETYLILIGN